MPDLDLKKITDSAAGTLTDYIETFLRVALKPAATAAHLDSELSTDPRRGLQAAITYAIISIVIGLGLGAAVKLPGTPSMGSADVVIGLLFLWVLLSLLLHGMLRLIRGRGALVATIAVFLYVYATVHLLWIPIFSVAAAFGRQTEVTLTYDYLVNVARDTRIGETYIKEEEPEKEGTVLPPIASRNRSRVSAAASPWPLPKRSEKLVLTPDRVFFISIGYYLTMCLYFSKMLSVVHGKSWLLLFVLAAGSLPILLLVVLSALLTAGLT